MRIKTGVKSEPENYAIFTFCARMMIRKHIPNLITLLNVFCGCVATVFAVKNQLETAALFVALGIFFDFFDGLTARLLNVKSALGLQLDSLADVITSGLVPGVVLYQLFQMALAGQWDTGSEQGGMWNHWEQDVLPFFGFIVTMLPPIDWPSSMWMKIRPIVLSVCLHRQMRYSSSPFR